MKLILNVYEVNLYAQALRCFTVLCKTPSLTQFVPLFTAVLTKDGVVRRRRPCPGRGDVGEGAICQDVHEGGEGARARSRTDDVLQDLGKGSGECVVSFAFGSAGTGK